MISYTQNNHDYGSLKNWFYKEFEDIFIVGKYLCIIHRCDIYLN